MMPGALRFLVLALGVSLGCKTGGEPLITPVAVRLGLAVGPSAQAQSGALLSPHPVVQLLDEQNQPVARSGQQVTAVLLGDQGTLTGTLVIRTDHDGKAVFADLGLSGPVGTVRLRFDSPGLASATSDPIELVAGVPALLTSFAGNLQTAVAGTPVPVAPAVRLTDATGNPLAGLPVNFVASAGGTVEGAAATTNSNGVASPTRWTLSTVIGLNTLSATSTALAGQSVDFTATGTVGPPAVLTISAGEGQSATIGGNTAVAPAVLLTDVSAHPLPGVVLTFAVASGGGSVTGASALTDAAGIATVGSWALGLVPGPNTLSVSRTGVPPLTIHATGVGFSVSVVGPGNGHTCALDGGGTAYCWGLNANGQLGNGALVNDSVPTLVSGGRVFTSIQAGIFHTCGIVANGDAYCWGANDFGQLGDGTLTPHPVPGLVAGGFKYASIHPGGGTTCGLLQDGSARCWGFGQNGQIGDDANSNRSLPTLVAGGHSFTALSTGASHSCGRVASGAVFCWGFNGNGRLGDGTTTNQNLPTQVSGGVLFASVSAGATHSCGVTAAGAGYCWGNGAAGRLGNGAATDQLTPLAISGALLLATVSAGSAQSCGLTTGGEAWCWGLNSSGELGDGTFTNRLVPTLVAGGLSYATVRAGAEHSCARSTAGVLYCWGRNDAGALGDGTLLSRPKPVGVVKP